MHVYIYISIYYIFGQRSFNAIPFFYDGPGIFMLEPGFLYAVTPSFMLT